MQQIASLVMGFIVLVSSRWETPSQYGGGVTFTSHSWGIRPITTHGIAGQSEHLASQNDELCKNRSVSERWGNYNLQYLENKVFFLL